MKGFYWRGGNFLPWINIYATGSIMIYLLTYKLKNKPWLVFLTSFISCGILEYFSGLGMYILGDGLRCWDYNSEILNFGNIGGFVIMSFTLCSIILIDEFYNLLFARLLHLPRASTIYRKLGIPYVSFK